MKKFFFGLLLMGCTLNALAAKEIRHSEKSNMTEKTGAISVEIMDGTIDDAVSALEKKADEKKAKFFLITSIDMEGMGTSVRATADLYN